MKDLITFTLNKLEQIDPEVNVNEVISMIKLLKECGFDGINPLYPCACHLFNRYYKEVGDDSTDNKDN